ncbi:hypothetical protein A3I46_03070 [Candidatus Kaiserbacteria bacterium RIFCSPLOWO2_02_FULL_54_13]|uniref:Uncharacterized protein n=1 Tax=Candidatus Kaiserbacteria bacterium RIFCSPHIGHO2_02_FULL_54_22 TaxID=1798495 RepID=A0A1F6DNH0_9BACT|nr:MAG: hypothetical protein UY89_C0005G0003 [Parcubacteria group bacterium GW2011_GWA1_54_9]KKW42767.1 MAG: hypothetical protein UY91_C0001G0006 [Parcubacteria group bacterium GW2011_GWB1_55_9]OGG62946.1 MAG: hypothetical protein A3C19_02415 [Candidatus Kaiserbacteria bacterium RIFCSPHIGHO2_02_FULL_54_22]OGG68003.1 MAG: hypothetical protein A3E99_01810 [Candidatus Kaiserbacteria bacterium RIFCSPHIGHO2_12_FULL_54_16]OGG83535.1 MAG: hypothetical protein A3I46_03070 [Candidatus Kaiserbacteria bac
MSHIRLWTSAAIIAVVIIVGFVLSVPHTRDVPRPTDIEEQAPSVPGVALHDSFKKGVHTITGSLMAPNACTTVTATAEVAGSAPDTESLPAQAGILISISMPEDTGVCLQLPTRANFSVTVKADAGLPIRATVNGLAATIASS